MKNGNNKNYCNKTEGFVALISVVLISAILMLVATSLSFSGFYGRYNVLDSELKAQSKTLAQSCVDTALLKLAHDYTYNPLHEIISIGENSCTIESLMASGTQKILRTNSNYKNYTTNLIVTIQSANLSIVSWEETP